MEIRKVLALRGPNFWANFPVLEAWVDLGDLKDSPSDEIAGFNDRIMGWLPTMIEHRCSVGERGGFFERLRRGTYLAHILEHVTLELQSLAGTPVGFGRARETLGEGYYKVAIEYEAEELGRACLAAGHRLCLAAVHDLPFDMQAEVAKLREICQRVCLGPSTKSIVRAAQARGIPVQRMNSGSMVQLGYGSQQRRILAAQTDRTGAVAEEIAQDKDLTRDLLRAVGVPVPEGRPVTSADDAWEAADDIGVPVVVKPQFGSQGRGVATNLSTREQVLAAYQAASRESPDIMVEKFAPGADYRVLVIGGRMIAAARREPAQVLGDGLHTVAELVAAVNLDPRRGDDHATALSKIRLDPIALAVLAEQGLSPEAVPPLGACVLVRRNANLSTGGTAADVTDLVHPDVAARAIEAANVVGLDVAGIDVVCLDIGRPLEEQGGMIIEVNASPGLRMHLEPSSGTPRPVGEAIIDTLFADGQSGRIPVAAITGTNGKTTTTRFLAHIVAGTGRRVGMSCTDGIFLGSRRIDAGDCSGPRSARAVLANPAIDVAVFETARGGILREGLGFDRCEVAVVTNIGEGDHLGVAGIDTLEQLAKVKCSVVDTLLPTGTAVLKADDPLVAEMAKRSPAPIIFFARDPRHPVLAAHREQGGRAVYVREGEIVAAEGEREVAVTALAKVPLTFGGRIGFQVENALAATAAAWALGLSRESIRAGLESFAADMQHVPGRFNLLEINGATVIIDYGHNVSALSSLVEALDCFPSQRRVAVYSAAGDRRDSDMIRQGELLGDSFDHVILYEDHYLRGRAAGEIMAIFRTGLAAGSRVSEVTDICGAIKAVDLALKNLRAGDLLLLQADVIDETVDFMRRYLQTHAASGEVSVIDALQSLQEAVVYAAAAEAID
ncbi:MAG TPA: cyanophycin synthetase [Pirellulales bacterium]